jgi:hypothetical protein
MLTLEVMAEMEDTDSRNTPLRATAAMHPLTADKYDIQTIVRNRIGTCSEAFIGQMDAM